MSRLQFEDKSRCRTYRLVVQLTDWIKATTGTLFTTLICGAIETMCMMTRAGCLIVPLRCFYERHREACDSSQEAARGESATGILVGTNEARMSKYQKLRKRLAPGALLFQRSAYNIARKHKPFKWWPLWCRKDKRAHTSCFVPRFFLPVLVCLQLMPALLVVAVSSATLEEIRVQGASKSRNIVKLSQVYLNRVAPVRTSFVNSRIGVTRGIQPAISLHGIYLTHTDEEREILTKRCVHSLAQDLNF